MKTPVANHRYNSNENCLITLYKRFAVKLRVCSNSEAHYHKVWRCALKSKAYKLIWEWALKIQQIISKHEERYVLHFYCTPSYYVSFFIFYCAPLHLSIVCPISIVHPIKRTSTDGVPRHHCTPSYPLIMCLTITTNPHCYWWCALR